jgi:hypothetical protein
VLNHIFCNEDLNGTNSATAAKNVWCRIAGAGQGKVSAVNLREDPALPERDTISSIQGKSMSSVARELETNRSVFPSHCECGNSAKRGGIYLCDSEGYRLESSDLVCCDRCGKITLRETGHLFGLRCVAFGLRGVGALLYVPPSTPCAPGPVKPSLVFGVERREAGSA